MVTIERKVLTDLIKDQTKEITEQWSQASLNLIAISKIVEASNCQAFIDYYNRIVAHAQILNFVTLDQNQMDILKGDLKEVPKNNKILFEVGTKPKPRQINFSQLLIETLGYTKNRSEIYPGFYAKLGIKACVYCNAQYALTHERQNAVSARYELDHVHDKAIYPYLSITLLNLVPVCGQCNIQKPRKREFNFRLYTDIPESSKYKFELCRKSLSKYLLSPDNSQKLVVKLKVSDKSPGDLQSIYSLESLYETQTDLAEEIIVKAKVYNKTYKTMLTKSFRKLKLNQELQSRVIFGTYTAEGDIHKRPMTKFAQDIAIDIGFLKRKPLDIIK